MAQHDYNIGDQNGFDFLLDLNNALSAIATNNAGSSEPNTTFAHMLWFDTNNDLMKVRNEANSEWRIVAKKDGSGWTPYRQGTALGTASVQPDTRYAHRDNNLSDIESKWRARANLGVIEDSFDPDFTNSPNAAARRGLVAAAIAAATPTTYGAIKTYAFLTKRGTGAVVAGDTYAGSDLVPAGVYVSANVADDNVGSGDKSALGVGSGALSGTWRAMGSFTFSSASNWTRATTFLRIS